MPTESKQTDFVSAWKLFREHSGLTIARIFIIEPFKYFIHRLTVQYFTNSTSHPDSYVNSYSANLEYMVSS